MPPDPDDAGPALLRHCPGCDRLRRELARERAQFATFKRLLRRHVERTGNARQSPELMTLYQEAER